MVVIWVESGKSVSSNRYSNRAFSATLGSLGQGRKEE
jgi:hypothetical protein